MPFPLAHPAAVLPLRRFCPKYLSLPALMVGSVSPDVGYCFGNLNVGEFSHRFLGSIGFCWPAGAVLLGLLYGALLPALERLPDRYKPIIPPVFLKPLGPPLVVLISLLIGAWTHLLWDSFTHKDGWFVGQIPLLQTSLASVAGHNVRVFHLLWYACSFAGIILLILAYQRWQQDCESGSALANTQMKWRSAVLLAVLVLPIELVHHLVHGALGPFLVAASTLMLMIGILVKIRPTQKRIGN
jgi:hypothetical protein